MYGKLYESIYDGTLVEDWKALVTFQQMIILCNADGILDMTAGAISRRTGIPKDVIEHGIEVLENPDSESRTPDHEGKRIIRIDQHRIWGWEIVNHKHYRDLRTQNDRREYMRNYMRDKREKEKLTSANESLQVSNVAHTDAYADTDVIKHKEKSPSEKQKKKKTFELPDYINPDVWKAFVEHRKKLRAPMTDNAKNLIISKMDKLSGNPNSILNQSIESGWKGVFELKKENNYGQNKTDSRSRTEQVSNTLDGIAQKAIDDGETL